MKDKIFESNTDELSYRIVIEVYKNCAITKIEREAQKSITYYEVIGVLESQKNHIIYTQREAKMKKKMKPKSKKP